MMFNEKWSGPVLGEIENLTPFKEIPFKDTDSGYDCFFCNVWLSRVHKENDEFFVCFSENFIQNIPKGSKAIQDQDDHSVCVNCKIIVKDGFLEGARRELERTSEDSPILLNVKFGSVKNDKNGLYQFRCFWEEGPNTFGADIQAQFSMDKFDNFGYLSNLSVIENYRKQERNKKIERIRIEEQRRGKTILKRESIQENNVLPFLNNFLDTARIALVTSGDSDALKDVRFELEKVEITPIPFSVQWSNQNSQMLTNLVAALQKADEGDNKGKFDFIILCRGGGPRATRRIFDNIDLAVCLAEMKTPTITGIGHANDVSIADLAATYCASTPSAAAIRLRNLYAIQTLLKAGKIDENTFHQLTS